MAGTSNRRTGQGKRALAAIQAGPGVRRPDPPQAFTKPERAVWHRIVDACPPDWFTPECAPLLARLCVLIVMSEQLEAVGFSEVTMLSQPVAAAGLVEPGPHVAAA